MPARATIEILEGGSTSRAVSVPRGGLTLGRAKDETVILRSPSVSARHAELFWQGDDLFVRDVGSSYGTRRDGEDLKRPARLLDGDELVLGGAAVVRISLEGAGFGAPLSALADVDEGGAIASEAPATVEPEAIDLLPILESLYQATSEGDLDHRLATAAAECFHPSRLALIELEGTGQRFRVLAILGASPTNASFVSRTMVAEAAHRGIAHYREADRENAPPRSARDRPVASVIRSGASSAIAAAIQTRDGRARVLYLDAFLEAGPLEWAHAMTLQLLAAHAAGAYETLRARIELLDDQRRFEQLRRYFSPAVAEHVLKGQLDVVERPQTLEATVLFADMVGYTALSERLRGDPERLLSLLNLWLDAGARAVLGHAGTLDKFIGDAVMAVFGAPLPTADGEIGAVRCALEMREAARAIARDTGEPIEITVGINAGEVVAGSVGSRRRLEYTVLGDTVNVASRLQGRAAPGEILVGERVATRLRDAVVLEDAGELALRHHTAVRAYRVVRLKGPATAESRLTKE